MIQFSKEKNIQVDYSLLEYYKTLGTVVECREAIEKQRPIKINISHKHHTKCKCGHVFSFSSTISTGQKYYDVVDKVRTNYCPDCGQKLEWSEEEE